jgi:hypothetical protein
MAHWVVSAATLALLFTGIFASGSLLVQAFRHGFAGSRALSHRSARPTPQAEGAWFQLSHFGKHHPTPGARIMARRQAAALPRSPLGGAFRPSAAAQPAATPATSYALGPEPIASPTYGANSGRITALAVNPCDANDVWAGAADGGLWHSTTGGASWSPSTDTQPTLSIGAIAIGSTDCVNHPSVYTLYVGTGEANLNGDAYWGVGILKSLDGGNTWVSDPSTGNPWGYTYFAGLAIGKIAVDPDPTKPTTLVVAVSYAGPTSPLPGSNAVQNNEGIWQSPDGGATWLQTLADTSAVLPIAGTDVVFDPNPAHPGVVYAGLSNIFSAAPTSSTRPGVWVSASDGATWTQLNSVIPTGQDVGRVSLGISQDGARLYAALTDSDAREAANNSPNYGALLNNSVYVGAATYNATSKTVSVTWTANNVSSVGGPMNTDDGSYQWWYDSTIAVDPNNGSVAYVGGVDLWQTTDGGTTWTNLTNALGASPAGVHPDQHALAFFSPTSSSFYLGNDGGVWSSASGTSYINRNSGGLNITQFYGGSIGEAGGDAQLYGGAQDNGEDQYPAGAISGAQQWNEVFGGDGGNTVVDDANNATVYEESVYGDVSKSTDGGQTWHETLSGLGTCSVSATSCASEPVNFIMPLVESPVSGHNGWLFAGTSRVHRTTNGATSWSAISPPLDIYDPNYPGGVPISALAVAPSNDNVLYAGDDDGHIYGSVNGGASWNGQYSGGGAIPGSTGGMVTGLAVDPTNPSVVYASFADFSPTGGHHLYKTTSAGASWIDISASLPNVPFAGLLVSPNNSNLLIAGSDVGIFVSEDAGSTWAQLGAGLPNVAIDQIFLNHTGTRLFVATHGRGMWELTFSDIQLTPHVVHLAVAPGTTPSPQTVTIQNGGFGTLNWSQAASPPASGWLASVTPSSGSLGPKATQTVTLTFNTPSTTPQTYATNLVFRDPNADNPSVSMPVSVVASQVAKTWYFAEGYTGGSFTEYLTLANPSPTQPAHVTVEYLLQSRSTPQVGSYTVAAATRATILVNHVVGGGQSVSAVVISDVPIVAERPMYFSYTGLPGSTIPGGTDVVGATSLATQFDFGYLDTSPGHDTWLTVLNPNSTDMTISIRYFAAVSGTETDRTHTVAANRRGTVRVNTEGLPAGRYSALVTLSAPGLVERPLYLRDGATGLTGAASVVGVATPQPSWYFAEGYTGGSSPFHETYVLANPSTTTTAVATVTFLTSDGTTTTVGNLVLAPGAQLTVDANSALGPGVSNSAVVRAVQQGSPTTPQPILAERVQLFRYTGQPGASDVLGAASPGYQFAFAEGYTGGQFAEYLTIENPDPALPASVQVSFLPSNRAAPTVRTYGIGPHSRFTLNTGSVMPGQSFSMTVESSLPVVAERPMYFTYAGSQTGGSDVVGYQPLGSCPNAGC